MAVPSSGQLSMRGLHQEKEYDNYGYTIPVNGQISLADLAEGGNSHGSLISYESTNTNSASYPNAITPHSIAEWYGYDHDVPYDANALNVSLSRVAMPAHSANKPYNQQTFYYNGASWVQTDSVFKNFDSSNTPSNWYYSWWNVPQRLNQTNRIWFRAVSTPNWTYRIDLYTNSGYEFENSTSTTTSNITVTSVTTGTTTMTVYFTINNTGNFTQYSAYMYLDFNIKKL